MERVVRVEEELRALREIQIAHFNAAEKRFEAMDKRFEALQREMTARFEALQREMTARFEAQQREMTARFEAVDKRFEALQGEMAARFEAMDRRFEAMERRFRFQEWMIAGGVTLIVGLLTVLKIFSRALSARTAGRPSPLSKRLQPRPSPHPRQPPPPIPVGAASAATLRHNQWPTFWKKATFLHKKQNAHRGIPGRGGGKLPEGGFLGRAGLSTARHKKESSAPSASLRCI
uniref:OmpH family outer membrane protein n=1 Tax=Desulfacinum infernum TaxID=35837 RepID=A0A832A5W6_9BACT